MKVYKILLVHLISSGLGRKKQKEKVVAVNMCREPSFIKGAVYFGENLQKRLLFVVVLRQGLFV